MRKELTALGFRHRLCLAPNPVAARVLANSHDGLAIEDETALQRQLSALPLDRLGLSRELAVALGRMGLRHLRQVLELPRAALARRFPAELLLHIDRLCGRSPLALEHYRPPDTFDLRIELNFDVESHQTLLFPLRRLSADLAAFLAGRDSGVQRFTLHLEHHGRADSQVTVGLLSAEREAAMLFELTRGRLEQLQLPAPVHAVRLEARELPPFTPQHRELFDERPQQYLGWEQLRERLRARLGDEAVQGLSAVAEHRPERSWRPHSCDRAQSPAACGLRPGWLLAEPRLLGEALPTVLTGPERIESGWWDGEDIRRDYYLVETRSGQRAWVYREVGSEGPLWLHGWFA